MELNRHIRSTWIGLDRLTHKNLLYIIWILATLLYRTKIGSWTFEMGSWLCWLGTASLRDQNKPVCLEMNFGTLIWSMEIVSYFAPGRDANCEVLWWVCLSVCPLAWLENHTTKLYQISVHVACDSVLLWWHCNMLCTASFVDDVMFSHNGPLVLHVYS